MPRTHCIRTQFSRSGEAQFVSSLCSSPAFFEITELYSHRSCLPIHPQAESAFPQRPENQSHQASPVVWDLGKGDHANDRAFCHPAPSVCQAPSLTLFPTAFLLNPPSPSKLPFPSVIQSIFSLQKAQHQHPGPRGSISIPIGLRRHFPRKGAETLSQRKSNTCY